MDSDQKLLKVAIKLVEALDKEADKCLPKDVSDVVKLHSKIAVGSAWIPVPGVDAVAGAANIWTMYGRINSKLGFTIKDNVLKTIASGVATNLASYLAVSGVASAMKLIPGIGSIGGAIVMSASLYVVTLASGYVYLKALLLLAQQKGPQMKDLSGLGEAINTALKDSNLSEFISEAKKEYKK